MLPEPSNTIVDAAGNWPVPAIAKLLETWWVPGPTCSVPDTKKFMSPSASSTAFGVSTEPADCMPLWMRSTVTFGPFRRLGNVMPATAPSSIVAPVIERSDRRRRPPLTYRSPFRFAPRFSTSNPCQCVLGATVSTTPPRPEQITRPAAGCHEASEIHCERSVISAGGFVVGEVVRTSQAPATTIVALGAPTNGAARKCTEPWNTADWIVSDAPGAKCPTSPPNVALIV